MHVITAVLVTMMLSESILHANTNVTKKNNRFQLILARRNFIVLEKTIVIMLFESVQSDGI